MTNTSLELSLELNGYEEYYIVEAYVYKNPGYSDSPPYIEVEDIEILDIETSKPIPDDLYDDLMDCYEDYIVTRFVEDFLGL